jgi:hypothetical protein
MIKKTLKKKLFREWTARCPHILVSRTAGKRLENPCCNDTGPNGEFVSLKFVSLHAAIYAKLAKGVAWICLCSHAGPMFLRANTAQKAVLSHTSHNKFIGWTFS